MCDNAVEIIAETMTELEPEVVDVEDILVIQATPVGIALLAAYNTLDTALTNWKPGDATQDVIQAINTLEAELQAISSTAGIPATVVALVGVILAALTIILGIVQGNSTSDTKERKQIAVLTVAKVKSFVPSFKESRWVELRAETIDPGAVAGEVKSEWNKVIATDPAYSRYKR